MFKSKARKEAEYRLKVERETQRIQQRQATAQQRQAENRQQLKALADWFRGLSPLNRNLLLTGVAGLFTGAVAGAIVSPLVFHQYNRRINNTALKWLAWAGTGLIAAPLLIGAQSALFEGEPETRTVSTESQSAPAEVQASPAPAASTSVQATVNRKGLDFAFEAPGEVVKTGDTLVVTYHQRESCDNGRVFDQVLQDSFNLKTLRWSQDRAQPISNCVVDESGEWLELNADMGTFTISDEGGKTTIRADALEGTTMLVKDAAVVRYQD